MENENDNIKTPLCGCGCGNPVKKRRGGTYNAFLVGHNTKHSNATSV